MRIRFVVIASIILILQSSCHKKRSSIGPDNSLNKWDGRYRVEGTLTDVSDPQITWAGSYEYNLITTSSSQLKMVPKDLGIEGHLIKHGSSLSYYSQFGPVLTLDANTNKITAITNFYGQPSPSGRSAVLDPSGANAWDPVTKNIKIKFWMDETGLPGHRTSFDETWVYIGAR